jgi:hypothetical protein
MILDSEGHLVWFKQYDYLVTFNVNVYTYKGEKYLTYWTGNHVDGGHASGAGYMVSFVLWGVPLCLMQLLMSAA